MKPTMHIRYFLILLITLFFITFSSISTTLLYQYHFKKNTLPPVLSSLNHMITMMANSMNPIYSTFNYTVSLLLEHPSVVTLDPELLPSLLGEFLFYSPQISNAYIINIDNELIAGVNNNTLLHIQERNHIDSALHGNISSYASSINAEPFLQTAFPIYATEECVGALIITYDFSSLAKDFAILQSHFSSTHFYLFDESGKLLLTSETLDSKKFIPTTDIFKLCSTIDYDPNKPFTFLNTTSCYGRYLHIPTSNWTLLLTTPPPFLPSYLFFVFFCWYSFISLLFLLSNFLFKKKLLKSSYSNHNATIYWT